MANIQGDRILMCLLVLGTAASLFFKNSYELADSFRPSLKNALIIGIMAFSSILMLAREELVEFIYFNF